ncbi:Integrase core domain-containing protein, partial [Kocuria indica]
RPSAGEPLPKPSTSSYCCSNKPVLQPPVEPGQYTSVVLTDHLALEQIAPSIGSIGDAYDNALMETINGVYKAECVRTTIFHDGPYKTIADVEFATAGWVDWYNHRRLHGSLGMVSPDEFEAAYYAALNPEPLPA